MKKTSQHRITSVVSALIFIGGSISANAATYSWSNVDGNWNNAATWSGGVPIDTGSGTADRVNIGRPGKTLTVNSSVPVLGAEDFIIQNYGTLDVTTGGVLTIGYLRQQSTGSAPVFKVSGGAVTFTSPTAAAVRFGNGVDSSVQITAGSVTFNSAPTVSLGVTTTYTQTGGSFNTSSQNLTFGGAAYLNSRGDFTVSGGTFNAGTWGGLEGGATVNFTVDGDNQTAVNLGNFTAVTGTNVNLRFNLESGWSTKTALGNWNLSGTDNAQLSVDFGSLASSLTVGQTITLASVTSAPNLAGVALTSLTSGYTFIDVSDAGGLKIQITGVAASIPEPSSAAVLIGCGAFFVAALRKRRN